jgi:hypothetical protein
LADYEEFAGDVADGEAHRARGIIKDAERGDFRGEPVGIGCRVVRRDAEKNEEAAIDGANAFAGDVDVSRGDALQKGAHGNNTKK